MKIINPKDFFSSDFHFHMYFSLSLFLLFFLFFLNESLVNLMNMGISPDAAYLFVTILDENQL